MKMMKTIQTIAASRKHWEQHWELHHVISTESKQLVQNVILTVREKKLHRGEKDTLFLRYLCLLFIFKERGLSSSHVLRHCFHKIQRKFSGFADALSRLGTGWSHSPPLSLPLHSPDLLPPISPILPSSPTRLH